MIKTSPKFVVHDDVIKWKHFPRNWPFVREIHRSPVNFPHKGQWRGALIFSLIYARINDWVNNREAGDLRRQHGHYDVIVMYCSDLQLVTIGFGMVMWRVGDRPSLKPMRFNTLRPRQDGRHFPDDIFKCIFVNENLWISINISLKIVPKGPINHIPAMVQIMAWRRPGDKPLSEPMMISLPTHICVTRPQWVNNADEYISHLQASFH